MGYLVSVVIPIRHNDLFMNRAIRSIQDSSYKNVEILVVDEGKERGEQKNMGFRRAKGEYVLFLDSDMTIHPYLIEEAVIRLGNVDGLYIPEIIVGDGFWIRVRNFERSFYNGSNVDCIRFIRHDAFIPFDEKHTGIEDWDWDRRFKGAKEITHYPLYHHEKWDVRKYVERKKYYAKDFEEYKKRYGDKESPLNPLYRLELLGRKWYKLIRHPILVIGVLCLMVIKARVLWRG